MLLQFYKSNAPLKRDSSTKNENAPHPQVFFLLQNITEDILKNVGNQTVSGPLWLP